MSDRPPPYRRRTLPAPTDPAAVAASLAFQAPPPARPADRRDLEARILAYPGDWRRVALLLLDSRGTACLNDEALRTIAQIMDEIAPPPGSHDEVGQ